MARTLYAGLLFSLSVFAAEPVNQEADLTLELLEFLSEFGDAAETVPVDDDELDDVHPLDDEKAPPQTAAAKDVMKRGNEK
jgi:hypothetical protein